MNAQCSHLCLVENIYYSYIELSERRRGNILVGFPCVAKNRILVDVILSNAWENPPEQCIRYSKGHGCRTSPEDFYADNTIHY